MIQIILQDLTPILYPTPRLSRAALTDFNTKAYDRLELIDAMRVWDKKMLGLYRIKADLDVVTRELEESSCKYFFSTSRKFRVLTLFRSLPV